MNNRSFITWGLAATVALSLTNPSLAKADDDVKNVGEARIHVTIRTDKTDRDNDMRVYQQWYGSQVHGYDNTVDPETGERLSDLMQIVTDVSGNRLTVVDQSNQYHAVQVTSRTQIVQSITPDNRVGAMDFRGNRDSYPSVSLSRLISPGDLVVVEGYLHMNGTLVATSIRRTGRTRGYGRYDDRDNYNDRFMGNRAWGDVRDIDVRRGQIEVNTADGRRILTLTDDADVIIGNRTTSIESIRRGDRVVFYFDKLGNMGRIQVYRIAVLNTDQCYPDNDRPYWADRDRHHGDRVPDGPAFEGRLQYITPGIFFDTLTLRDYNDRTYTIRYAKDMKVINRDGNQVPVSSLRDNERLYVTYVNIAGAFFAEHIIVR